MKIIKNADVAIRIMQECYERVFPPHRCTVGLVVYVDKSGILQSNFVCDVCVCVCVGRVCSFVCCCFFFLYYNIEGKVGAL